MLAAMDDVAGGGDGKSRGAKIRDMEEVKISSSTKRRKVDGSELVVASSNENSFTTDSTMSSSASSSLWNSSHHVELSGVGKDRLRISDLKRKDSATEIRTVNIFQFSRETSPATSELSSAEIMESSSSSATKKTSPRNSERIRPSPAEIEEFFSAAEKQEQKRFVEKYNYDIVKDVPLEGRYHWIRLKP